MVLVPPPFLTLWSFTQSGLLVAELVPHNRNLNLESWSCLTAGQQHLPSSVSSTLLICRNVDGHSAGHPCLSSTASEVVRSQSSRYICCHCRSQGAVRRLSSSPRGGFSNTCPRCTISPDDVFFSFDTTWLGTKMHIWCLGGIWHFGEGKKCPPPFTHKVCLRPSWCSIFACCHSQKEGILVPLLRRQTFSLSVSLFLCFLLSFEIVLSMLGRDLISKLSPIATLDTDFCFLELCKNGFLLPPDEWYYFYCRWRQ